MADAAVAVPAAAGSTLLPGAIIAARRRTLENRATVHEFFAKLALFAVMLGVCFGLVFGIVPCPDNDMMPRIGAGDLLLYYRPIAAPRAADVLVYAKNGSTHIGRVVAKQGDTVEITAEGSLVVNGSTVVENYIYTATPRYDDLVHYPLTLDQGSCFVLCDTREGGRDSRYYGPVAAAEIKGRVITVLRRSSL